MKEQILELIEQIPNIESKFHTPSAGAGLIVPPISEISDVPEFQLWIQNIQFELQDIVDRTQDKFAADTLNVARLNYNGWHDRKNFNLLKGKLLTMKTNIEKYYPIEGAINMPEKKPAKIFISHATKDKPYVKKVVELLDDMGLDQTQIFCSSLPGYDIPIDTNIFDYLKSQFSSFDLHILFIHSKNYYKSPVCLNEMGAAWVLKTEYSSLLLPGFSFGEMTGVVNNQNIAIKLDNDQIEVKDKLNQLYTKLIAEFGITKKSDIIWEQKRDQFIQEINKIVIRDDEATKLTSTDVEMLDNGLLVQKSEVAAGKKIYYCPACYGNYKKLFPLVRGSLAKDRFCPNCHMRYTI